MQHFILFFYILSFSSGMAAFNVAILLFNQYKKESLKYYSFFLLSLVFLMGHLILEKYNQIVVPDIRVLIISISSYIYFIGVLLLIVILPFFSHSIMGIKISKIKKICFNAVNFFTAITLIFYAITHIKGILNFIIRPIMIISIMYAFFLIIADLNSIGEKLVRKAVNIFLIMTIVYFPFHLIEEYRLSIFRVRDYDLIDIFSLPLYFMILCLLSIVFTIRYYNKPAYWQDSKLSAYFKKNYKISEREEVIITNLVDGLNNKEISKKLFISIKTVENHLSNIYSKVNVKNRVQLVNIVLSNK